MHLMQRQLWAARRRLPKLGLALDEALAAEL